MAARAASNSNAVRAGQTLKTADINLWGPAKQSADFGYGLVVELGRMQPHQLQFLACRHVRLRSLNAAKLASIRTSLEDARPSDPIGKPVMRIDTPHD